MPGLIFLADEQPVCLLVLSRRPQYQPLSLKRLQYLIDLGRVDPTQPIDLTQLVNARGVTIQPLKRDHGVQLVEEVNVTESEQVHLHFTPHRMYLSRVICYSVETLCTSGTIKHFFYVMTWLKCPQQKGNTPRQMFNKIR